MGAEDDDPGPVVGLTGARFGGAPRRKARKRAAGAGGADGRKPDASATAAPRGDTIDAGIDERPTEAIPVVGSAPGAPDGTRSDSDRSDSEQPAVGLTGARFGGAQRKRRKARSASADPSEPASQRPRPPAGGPSATDEPPAAANEVAPAAESPGENLIAIPDDPTATEEGLSGEGGSSFVRPYVFTRGRTRPQFQLSMEALISAVPAQVARRLDGEHGAVLELCHEPRSVAEVAALLGVPLGVARVLVGDLAAEGVVTVHRTADDGGPDLALMERVLSGLRRL